MILQVFPCLPEFVTVSTIPSVKTSRVLVTHPLSEPWEAAFFWITRVAVRMALWPRAQVRTPSSTLAVEAEAWMGHESLARAHHDPADQGRL